MNKTKKRIIIAAISQFNEYGLSNVRNQDIAKESGISLSNFNYHFKTKQDLVYEVCDYMVAVLQQRVYGNRVLMNTEEQSLVIMRSYLEFEEEFKFFYLDTYNILQSYPALKDKFQNRLNEAIVIIKNLNFLSVGKGTMKPEPADMPGLYDKLAEQIWLNTHFWFCQMHIRGMAKEDTVLKGMESNFAILYPYMNENGRAIHKAYIAKFKDEINA